MMSLSIFKYFFTFLFFTAISSLFAVETFVSSHRAKVVPAAIWMFAMPEPGILEISDFSKERAEVNTLIAYVNRAKLDDEKRDLELKVSAEKLVKKNEILQLIRRREELDYLRKLDGQERGFIRKSNVDADARSLALLDEQIAVAEAQMKHAEQRTLADFERRREAFDLRMPFAGRIQWHVPFLAGASAKNLTLRLPAGAPIATIADDSAYYVAVNFLNPALLRLPTDRLSVRLLFGTNESFDAVFSHKRVEKSGNAEALVYYFKIPKEMHTRAFDLLGANCVAKLFYRSEKPLKVFSKLELVRAAAGSRIVSWEALIAEKFPGKRIVFIGDVGIALESEKSDG